MSNDANVKTRLLSIILAQVYALCRSSLSIFADDKLFIRTLSRYVDLRVLTEKEADLLFIAKMKMDAMLRGELMNARDTPLVIIAQRAVKIMHPIRNFDCVVSFFEDIFKKLENSEE